MLRNTALLPLEFVALRRGSLRRGLLRHGSLRHGAPRFEALHLQALRRRLLLFHGLLHRIALRGAKVSNQQVTASLHNCITASLQVTASRVEASQAPCCGALGCEALRLFVKALCHGALGCGPVGRWGLGGRLLCRAALYRGAPACLPGRVTSRFIEFRGDVTAFASGYPRSTGFVLLLVD